ncbi:MAG: chemotaxis protein CheB [Halobacteriales archaeon]|nr:chemotaxis protein CheB [Halobacteriales archaeon]
MPGPAKTLQPATPAKAAQAKAVAPRTPPAVVGVGASAGGLDALTKMLRAVPAGKELAIIVVQHLDPGHASVLTGLLARATRMVVAEAQDGVLVQPGHVYVMPPNAILTIEGGRLCLAARPSRGPSMPVDAFLRSLAADQGARAVGVVLSGTNTDGALGIRAIRAAGGTTFAQDEATAAYPGRLVGRSWMLPSGLVARRVRRAGRHAPASSSVSTPCSTCW